MTKSATELMQDILAATAIDAVMAMKAASGGLANGLVRDVGAVHANTTFADLPKQVQDAITGNVRIAFTKLLKEGYAIAPSIGTDRGTDRSSPRSGPTSGGGPGPRPRPPGTGPGKATGGVPTTPGGARRPDSPPPATRPRRPRSPR